MKKFLHRFLFLSGYLLCIQAFAGSADRTLDIYWIDVEGGGATLIVTPAGESILIDSGNPGVRDPGRIHKTATEVAGLEKDRSLRHDPFSHAIISAARRNWRRSSPSDRSMTTAFPIRIPDGIGANTRTGRHIIKPYREFKADGRSVLSPATRFRSSQPPARRS